MKRKKDIVRNILIAAVMLFFVYILGGFFPTAMDAFHTSERSSHYGPSNILCTVDVGNTRHFFGSFKQTYSHSETRRLLPFMWRFGDQSLAMERGADRPMERYADKQRFGTGWFGGESRQGNFVFGPINSPDVASIEVKTPEGVVLRCERGDYILSGSGSNGEKSDQSDETAGLDADSSNKNDTEFPQFRADDFKHEGKIVRSGGTDFYFFYFESRENLNYHQYLKAFDEEGKLLYQY